MLGKGKAGRLRLIQSGRRSGLRRLRLMRLMAKTMMIGAGAVWATHWNASLNR